MQVGSWRDLEAKGPAYRAFVLAMCIVAPVVLVDLVGRNVIWELIGTSPSLMQAILGSPSVPFLHFAVAAVSLSVPTMMIAGPSRVLRVSQVLVGMATYLLCVVTGLEYRYASAPPLTPAGLVLVVLAIAIGSMLGARCGYAFAPHWESFWISAGRKLWRDT